MKKDTKVPQWGRSARVAGDSDGRKYKTENKTETNDRKNNSEIKK